MMNNHCRVLASPVLRSSNPDFCHAEPQARVRF